MPANEKKLYKYTSEQYPFTGLAENVKKIKIDNEIDRNDILIRSDLNEHDTGLFYRDSKKPDFT